MLATFTFKRPVPTKPEPLTSFDSKFLRRVDEIEDKISTVNLSSGRKMCYFEESIEDVANLPVVLCLHGLGQSKEAWIQPEPIPNVRIIAVDRMGHGCSSPAPARYGFIDCVTEIEEILNKVGVDKFYVVGHSSGGTLALQIAAGLGDRVLGVASISAPCDLYLINT